MASFCSNCGFPLGAGIVVLFKMRDQAGGCRRPAIRSPGGRAEEQLGT